jgi:prophage regulatory protein
MDRSAAAAELHGGNGMNQQLLRLHQVRDMVGLSRSEIYRRVALGEFPQPVSIGARAVAWVSAEVQAWVKQQIAVRNAARKTA